MTPPTRQPIPDANRVGNRRGRSLLLIGSLGAATLVACVGLALLAWPADPDAVWDEARIAFESRRFPEADGKLKVLASLRPPTPLDWMLRAQVAMGMDREDEAIDDLLHVPVDHKMAASAQLELGQLFLRRDRFNEAEKHFLKALELDPGRVQARRELVYIYGMQIRRVELNETFRALSEVSSLTYPEVFLWCLTRGVTWEPDEIVKVMARVIRAEPDNKAARLAQASSLALMGRFDEADQALAPLQPSDPDARAARARVALARGDDLAVEGLLAEGPADHLDLALLRGQMALVRGDADEALKDYRVAYRQNPGQREAVFGLGKALQMTGSAEAGPLLDRARKLDELSSLVQKAAVEANRKDPELVRALGAACASVGRYPEARAWYNLAIARDPLDAKAQQGLAKIPKAEDDSTRKPSSPAS